MQKLNVRFSTQTKKDLSKLVKLLGFDDSKIARAAIDFGIEEIVRVFNENGKRNAVNKIGIHGLKEAFKK